MRGWCEWRCKEGRRMEVEVDVHIINNMDRCSELRTRDISCDCVREMTAYYAVEAVCV